MSDFLIDDASGHFAASKNTEYRDRVRRRFKVFLEFLQRNDLTTRTILLPGSEPDSSIKIMKSDLTEIGFAVVKLAYDKWLGSHDRGKPIEDVTLLERALAKVTPK